MTVRDVDKGARALRAAIADLERGPRLTIGVHEDVGAEAHRGPTEATVVEVAVAQEFARGTSWLRSTVDEQRSKIEVALAAAARRAIKSAIFGKRDEGHVSRALGRVVVRFARALQTKVRRLRLIDTSHLLEAIEGRVDNQVPTEEAP